MGRLPLPVRETERGMNARTILLAGLIAVAPTAARALEILDVKVADSATVGGKTLALNGAGVRSATILKVKVYVASFYTSKPLTTAEEVLKVEGPVRLDLTYVRPFDQKK